MLWRDAVLAEDRVNLIRGARLAYQLDHMRTDEDKRVVTGMYRDTLRLAYPNFHLEDFE